MFVCKTINLEQRPLLEEFWLRKDSLFKDKISDEYFIGLANKMESLNSNSIVYAVYKDNNLVATWSVCAAFSQVRTFSQI